MIRILYFAWLRERTGCGEEQISLPSAVSDVASLVTWLRSRSEKYAGAFTNPKLVRCAVNQVFADPATPVGPGDEIAFFPPVTGG